MSKKSVILVAALAGLLAAIPIRAMANSSAELAEVARAIRQRNTEIENNIAAGDAVRLVEQYYAPDVAILVPPGHPFVTGRENIIEFWRRDLQTANSVKLKTTHIELHGELAVEVGTYLFDLTTPSGEHIQEPSKYSVTFRKQPDGEWRAVIDMWGP